MPEVHIRKELYEKLEGQGVDTTEKVNEIIHNYIASRNTPPANYAAEDMHLREYHEHGNAD